MFYTIPTKFLFGRTAKVTASSLALLLCTACGGSGGNSSSPTPSVTGNQAPVVVVSKASIVTEGQPFTLDASGSTDPEGNSLSYSWRQLSGPSVALGTASSAKLDLTAPMLDADQALSFEVSVSDGTNTSASTVSLSVEDLRAKVELSETTKYGTGGPQTPTETVGDPSLYEGDKPLDRIIGLTSGSDGGYTVHWTADNFGRDMPVSSQVFTADGEKNGAQVDGVYLGGEQGTYTSSHSGTEYTAYNYGLSFATLYSGDTLYNFNIEFSFADTFNLEMTSHRGLVSGEIDGFGDTLYQYPSNLTQVMGVGFAPIGEGNFLLSVTESAAGETEDDAPTAVMTSYVVDEFGQITTHELGEYVSNGTDRYKNTLVLSRYQSDSYLAAWSQNTAETGYEIMMQRANEDGILLGNATAVNVETDGDQLAPFVVTMSGGNILLVWSNFDADGAAIDVRARAIRPDGTFATDEIILPISFEDLEENGFSHQRYLSLTALHTNEALLTWKPATAEEPEIRALVLNENLEVVSNEFLIATGDTADAAAYIWSTVLPDNKVILGWYNDYESQDDRDPTSHTVGFYPVGKD